MKKNLRYIAVTISGLSGGKAFLSANALLFNPVSECFDKSTVLINSDNKLIDKFRALAEVFFASLTRAKLSMT